MRINQPGGVPGVEIIATLAIKIVHHIKEPEGTLKPWKTVLGAPKRLQKSSFGSTGSMSDELSILDRPLTLEEAAEYLQLPSRTVRELCTRKKLAHARLNYRNFRFRRADLDAYVDKRIVQISWLK